MDGCSDQDTRLCLVEENWCNHIFAIDKRQRKNTRLFDASTEKTTAKKLFLSSKAPVLMDCGNGIPQFDGSNDMIPSKSVTGKVRKTESHGKDRKMKKVSSFNHKPPSDSSPTNSHKSHNDQSPTRSQKLHSAHSSNDRSLKSHSKEHRSFKLEFHSKGDDGSKFPEECEKESTHLHHEKYRKHKAKHHRRDKSLSRGSRESTKKDKESRHHKSSHEREGRRPKLKKESSSHKK